MVLESNFLLVGQKDVWDKDSFKFDWECLAGCPPGFQCPNGRIEICMSGAALNGGCATCPAGYICQPGHYPRPCPLGQHLLITSKRDRKITWGSQDQESLNDINNENVRLFLKRNSILREFMNARTVQLGINVVSQHLDQTLVHSKSTIATLTRLLAKNAIRILANIVPRGQENLKNHLKILKNSL